MPVSHVFEMGPENSANTPPLLSQVNAELLIIITFGFVVAPAPKVLLLLMLMVLMLLMLTSTLDPGVVDGDASDAASGRRRCTVAVTVDSLIRLLPLPMYYDVVQVQVPVAVAVE